MYGEAQGAARMEEISCALGLTRRPREEGQKKATAPDPHSAAPDRQPCSAGGVKWIKSAGRELVCNANVNNRVVFCREPFAARYGDGERLGLDLEALRSLAVELTGHSTEKVLRQSVELASMAARMWMQTNSHQALVLVMLKM